jgi:hypothetical protein
MEAACTDVAGRPNEDGARINVGVKTDIDTLVLSPGVYTFGSDVTFLGTTGGSGPIVIFIIQISGATSLPELGR